jgi:IrrE N-terminal-like domain
MREKPDPIAIYAQGFLDTFGVDCGLRLEEMAASIGLTITEVNADSFDGALVRVVGVPRGMIAINANIREQGRKRFTLAHEIGHYVLPGHSASGTACRAMHLEQWTPRIPQPELEANRFAAEILLPRVRIVNEVRREPSLRIVREIAGKSQTSITAALYRVVELSTYPAAMVWSVQGRRSWYKVGREFGRAVELGPIADQSYAFDCFQGRTVPESPEPVPATAWLYEDHLTEGARVWEESLFLPYYEAVLTLLLLRESVDDREVDEQPLEELDPTEFTLNRKQWPRK